MKRNRTLTEIVSDIKRAQDAAKEAQQRVADLVKEVWGAIKREEDKEKYTLNRVRGYKL